MHEDGYNKIQLINYLLGNRIYIIPSQVRAFGFLLTRRHAERINKKKKTQLASWN